MMVDIIFSHFGAVSAVECSYADSTASLNFCHLFDVEHGRRTNFVLAGGWSDACTIHQRGLNLLSDLRGHLGPADCLASNSCLGNSSPG